MATTITAPRKTTITSVEAAALIASLKHDGEQGFFSVKFIKRTNGEIRDMVCRLDVKKYLRGGAPAYDFAEKNLVCVCDVQIARQIADALASGNVALAGRWRSPYRSINLDAILEIACNGHRYTVKG